MNQPDTSLFIGQSPLQILNLVEASRAYGKQGPLLIVYDTEEIRAQIESLLQRLGVSEYTFRRRNLWFRMTFPLTLGLRFLRLRDRVDTVFFGTYTSWASFLVNLLKPGRHVLVDDGQKTITIVTAPESVGLGDNESRSLFSRAYVNDAELFTFYDALASRHGRRAVPNRLASVAGQLMAGSAAGVPAAGPEDILFIGTHVAHRYAPFDAAMAGIVSLARGRRVLYLKHRRDDPAMIAALADRLGFEVLSFDLPLELVFHRLWAPHRPAVWTFGTTATDTLQAMYEDLEVKVYRLDPAGFTTHKLRDAFEGVYRHYAENPRVELLELDATPSPGSALSA
jgi:hypothetical protein